MSKFTQNPISPLQEEVQPASVDSDIAAVTDNAIRNCAKITAAMRFNSAAAASVFASISGILQNSEISNEEKKAQIAEQSKGVEDTALQVYANMAMGMLGSSETRSVNAAETPGIEKLSAAFAFLGRPIKDEDAMDKDNRLADMVGAYAGLMKDEDIDAGTKKTFETSFNETPEIAKIAKMQEGIVESQAAEEAELEDQEEDKKTSAVPIDDIRDVSNYDGKNWEEYKRNAIYGAKGAIAIGLLFAPGGIFLAPLFLWATKDFGRDPNEGLEEQRAAEAAEKQSQETLEFLNAFKQYLPDPEVAKQNQSEEQEEDLEAEELPAPASLPRKPGDEVTAVGVEAEEFAKKEAASLERTGGTLVANQEALERVDAVTQVATSTVDEATKAALAGVVGSLSGTSMEHTDDANLTHGVTVPQVSGAGAAVSK